MFRIPLAMSAVAFRQAARFRALLNSKPTRLEGKAFSSGGYEYKKPDKNRKDVVVMGAYACIQRSLNKDDASAAERAYVEYRIAGGPPSRPLIHAIMQKYAKDGEAAPVLALLAQLQDPLDGSGPPNQYSYGFAITALKRSFSSLYRGKKQRSDPLLSAKKALELYNDMITQGVPSSLTVTNETIDCLGKAGLADQALELFHRAFSTPSDTTSYKGQQAAFEQAAVKPSAHTFSILIHASATARQPDLARHIFDVLMPLHGVSPTLAVWNALLAAQTSVDAVYATWQEMQQKLGQADRYTERILVAALSSNPQLAAEVINELGSKYQQISSGKLTHNALLTLDLHGHSRPAAVVALHRRLEALVRAGNRPTGDFVIITGKSNAFNPALHSLKTVVRTELERQHLCVDELMQNPGRLLVPRASLTEFIGRHSRELALQRVMRAVRTRYMIVSASVAVLGAAAFLLPRLSPWL